jgi:hypothetical protein
VGPGTIPNPRNSVEIRRWISDGNCIEPFRALYPDQQEVSYVPFRSLRGGRDSLGKTRLDFFLMDKELIDKVQKVRYEERIGYDFDHKMVSLIFGKKEGNKGAFIYADSLAHAMAEIIGKVQVRGVFT